MMHHRSVSPLPLSEHRSASIFVEDLACLQHDLVAGDVPPKGRECLFCENANALQASGAQTGSVHHAARAMPAARIYQRGRSPTQSGRARESTWLLRFEPKYRPEIDFLMGWTGSRDTLQQVELRFLTLDEAVAFAKRRGLQYAVETPSRRKIEPKSYSDNFRPDRLVPR